MTYMTETGTPDEELTTWPEDDDPESYIGEDFDLAWVIEQEDVDA